MESPDPKKSEMNTSRGRLSYLREQLEASKAQIAQQEKEKQEMKTMIDQLKSRAANLSQNITDSSLNIPDDTDFVKVRRGSSGSEMSARVSSDEEPNKQLQELKDIIKEKEDIIRARNKAVQLLMSQENRQSENELLIANDNLKTQLDAVEKKLIELEEEKGSLQLKLLDIEESSKKTSASSSISDGQIEKDELRLRISELTAKVDSLNIAMEKEVKQRKLEIEERKSLQEQLDAERRESSNLKLTLQNSQSEIENVRHEYETVLRSKESEIVSLQIELEDKEERILHEKDEIIEELKEVIAKTRDDLETAETEFSRREGELQKYQNQLKEEVEFLEKREDDIIAENERKFKELKTKHADEINRLEENVASLRQELEDAGSGQSVKIETLSAQIKAAETANEKLQSELNNLNEKHKQEVSKLKKEVEVANEEKLKDKEYVEELEETLAEKDTVMSQIELENKDIKEAYNYASEQLSSLTSKWEENTVNREEFEMQLQSKDREITFLKAENERLSSELTNSTGLIDQGNILSERIDTLENDVDKYKLHIAQLHEEKNKRDHDLQAKLAELDELRNVNNHLQLELSKLSQGTDDRLMMQEKLVNEKELEIISCKNELTNATSALLVEQASSKKLRNELDSANNQLSRLKSLETSLLDKDAQIKRLKDDTVLKMN